MIFLLNLFVTLTHPHFIKSMKKNETILWDRKNRLLLMCVITYSSIIFLLFFQGIDGADGVIYADSADTFRQNRGFVSVESGTPIFSVRQGLLIPTAIALHLFGQAEWVLLLYPFITAVGCSALVFIMTRLFFGSKAAIVAVLVYSSIPLILRQGTVLGPEIPACFWATLGMLFTYLSITSLALKKNLLIGVLAGLCFGISWLHKESVIYLVPVVAIIIIIFGLKNRNSYWAGIAIATAAILCMGIEMVYFNILINDPLYHFHAVQKNFEVNGPYHYFVEDGLKGWKKGYYQEALIQRLFISGPLTIIRATFAVKLGFLAMVVALFTKNRQFLFSSIWLCGLSGTFAFFTTDFQVYRPLVLEPRYLTPLFIPASILTGGLISTTFNFSQSSKTPAVKWITACIPIVLLGGLIYSTTPGVRHVYKHRPTYKSLRKLPLYIPSDTLVFSDPKTLSGMKWLGIGSNRKLKNYAILEQEHFRTGYVVLYWPRLNKDRDTYQTELPSFIDSIPEHWQAVYKDKEVSVFLMKESMTEKTTSFKPFTSQLKHP